MKNRKYHQGASCPGIPAADMTPGTIRYLTAEQYRAEVLGLPPTPPAPRHWRKWVALALVCGFALGFCTSAPASELDSPMLNEMRELNEQTRLSEERRQFEWAERDMQDRRNRYESERRYEERRNDLYFGWDRKLDRRYRW